MVVMAFVDTCRLTGAADDSSGMAIILLRGLGELVELLGALKESIDGDGILQSLGVDQRLGAVVDGCLV